MELFKNTPPPPHFWPSHAKNLALFAVDNYLKSDEPLAKKKFEDKGIELVNLDLERDHLPFAAGSVDIIIINQVFEHVKAVFWILHEITRVLKPGGHLIVGVPNLAALHQRLLLLFGQQPSCIKNYSNHIRGYTKGDLIRLVNSAFDGWQLKHFGGGDFRPFPAFLAKPLAKIFPTLSGTIFFDFQKIKDYPDNGYLKAARQGYCLSSK
jgi:SAM-dependent methyltransferase